ncbi:M56 family metallopeptidase [Cyanobacterium stanieri LEGE 03274]|uniref:M56 family metallopeptidase n=1 Tax=Cyanobacterium stanieri LEGE 03274 TaxID=1828756 RepID=A0ABR9V5M2_9CHRO|nr:M56 family metallopeptidase [Cyanobacterium stanieri]MBE9223183.1 M56 family metallopeptidase [Cyanobacterium stanieri LEGE 03274]
MHFIVILLAIVCAYVIRYLSQIDYFQKQRNWNYSLFFFIAPVLLILMSSIAIVTMGYEGQMWGFQATIISYILAWFCLGFAVINLIVYAVEIKLISQKIAGFKEEEVLGERVKILESSFPYAGLIGFESQKKGLFMFLNESYLVLSRGLINLLSPEHLEAVIAHEKSHQKHHDPLIFFCLSYCKRITFWLPNNDNLWQNLVLLRELRADNTASQSVDFLLLAESLLMVTQEAMKEVNPMDNNMVCPFINFRLNERIDALINDGHRVNSFRWYQLTWILLVFIPFLTIPFHQ